MAHKVRFAHSCLSTVFEKTCATTQKNVKMFFYFKNVKNVKKRPYCFRGHLITPVFNTQLQKVSTGKSPTSNIFAQKCGRSVHIHKQLCNLELCVVNVIKVLKCTRLTNK